MEIERFNNCLELSALRETRLYTALRPYVHQRLAHYEFIKERRIFEKDQEGFSHEDKYFAKLDILFGQLFQNIKTRQYLKHSIGELGFAHRVSVLALTFLHRSYLNELVILFERLSSFLALFKKAFGKELDVTDLEKKLLSFFNPLLFAKRNVDQHGLYLGFPGYAELSQLEEQALQDDDCVDHYCKEFKQNLDSIIDWIEYTEKKISKLLIKHLNAMDERIRCDGTYLEPLHLPPTFSLGSRLNLNLRDRYNHDEIFKESKHLI